MNDLDQQLLQEEQLAAQALPGVRAAYKESRAADKPDMDLKFSYALLLVKSADAKDNREGLDLLRDLVDCNYHVTDCFYSMALGLYHMGHLDDARTQVEMLLRIDPDHHSAERLHKCLLGKISKRDQVVGLSVIAGGILAGGVGIVAALLLNSGGRRR